jgi:hypothetical protein
VELSITARRVELDTMFDLNKLLGSPAIGPVQAWVSGTVTLKTELAPVKPVEPEAWVELTEVMGIVNHRGTDGRLVPLRLSVIDQQPGARAALSVRLTPTTIELACRNASVAGGRAGVLRTLAGGSLRTDAGSPRQWTVLMGRVGKSAF